MTTLFGQPASPATLVSDANPYTLGIEFTCSSSLPLNGIWFFSASGAAALPGTIALYAVVGPTLVHSESASWSGSAGSGWVEALFSSPPTLTASAKYRACVLQSSSVNWYSRTANYWTSGAGGSGISNPPLSAPNSAGADNGGTGSFNSGASLAYPVTGTPDNYWIDVDVTAGGNVSLTVDAVTLAAPLLTPMVGPDPFPAPNVALAAPPVSLTFGAASIPLPVAQVTLAAPPVAAHGPPAGGQLADYDRTGAIRKPWLW